MCIDEKLARAGSENTEAFAFEPVNDSLGFSKNNGQKLKDRPTRGLVEGYKRGQFEAVLHCRPPRAVEEFQFCFRAIPKGPRRNRYRRSLNASDPQTPNVNTDHKRDIMLVGIGERAESSQIVIAAGIPVPSWVWLERLQSLVEFDGNVAAHSLSGKYTFEVAGVLPEGEIGLVEFLPTKCDSGAIDGLVQCVPQVIDDPIGDQSDLRRGLPNDFKIVNYLTGISLVIGDNAIWALCEKSVTERLELLDVFFRPINEQARTLK
jgi:hypothetical protein